MAGIGIGVEFGAAIIMVVAAAGVIVFGNATPTSEALLNVYIASYTAWIISTCVLAFVNLPSSHGSPQSIMRCIHYLLWTGLTLWVFHRGFGVHPRDLPYYFPMCTNIGIVLCTGASNAWMEHLRPGVPRTLGVGTRYLARNVALLAGWVPNWWNELRRSAAGLIAPSISDHVLPVHEGQRLLRLQNV